MLLPVQGSLLPSCPSLIFSQSYLQARSLCQVPLGAPVHLQPQLRPFLHCPCVPPALMQPQINPFFSLIPLLHWPHLFSSTLTGTISLLAALPIPCPATAFCLSLKICQQLPFSPLLGQSPVPELPGVCTPPPTCTPDSTRHPPAPTLSSLRFNFSSLFT